VSIPRWQRLAALAATCAAVSLVTCTDLRSADAWRDAPEYLDLFAPGAHRENYRAYVSSLGMDETLKTLSGDPATLHPPGAWEPQAVTALDAFGRTGSYNRWQLAGLYGSRRVRVARGPRVTEGRAESWMLVTPYPDPAMRHLESGTLIVVVRLPPV
jgi:hypothetical protein